MYVHTGDIAGAVCTVNACAVLPCTVLLPIYISNRPFSLSLSLSLSRQQIDLDDAPQRSRAQAGWSSA